MNTARRFKMLAAMSALAAMLVLAGCGGGENNLTVSDYADILMKIEKRQGYEAARRYVTNNIDYTEVTAKAKGFIDGTDKNAKNDPNIMPTRFMLLYGADDAKLRVIDPHPDRFDGPSDQEHKITVENLRKGLKLAGYDVEEDGPFDGALLSELMKYLKKFKPVNFYRIKKHGGNRNLMLKYGMPSWRYFNRVTDSHDSIMNEISPKYGDELLAKAGGGTRFDKSRFCYRYPWVAFRLRMDDDRGGRESEYQVFNTANRGLVAKGLLDRGRDVIETLLPDAEDIEVFVNGVEIDMSCVSCVEDGPYAVWRRWLSVWRRWLPLWLPVRVWEPKP